ncbi:auxin-responsive protein IAA10-like [Dioscorea cayenensis subsp. rotundata]|uniref:Auxin-responsive protein n=1 Tax=Dioscorea cayennensis subsp. rotundata TaxID=55577 RepID=A0AB40BF36_DIOCR|nr:auxin-responsive protein IAA10-like [Dioscorea cayenensis subsp. rotundata]
MRNEACDSSGSMSSVGLSEPAPAPEEELELGLSLGAKKLSGGGGRCCRILTAKDLPSLASRASSSSSVSSSNGSPNGVAGTKRVADVVGSAANPSSQMVVGWPPIRAFRMNNLVNQSKDTTSDGDNALKKSNKKESTCGKDHDKQGSSLFVKVNMDGDPIGRKVDLNAHLSYDSLAHALELMFRKPTSDCVTASKLLGGLSEFALTYEDKDGDWMLVGDVPWRMFLSAVKRLRIMRTSDANGLLTWNTKSIYN